MSDALQSLPPEAVALIKEGTPKPQTQSAVLTPTAVSVKPISAVAPKPAAQAQPAPRSKAPKEEPLDTGALVTMTFRLPASMPQALLRASADRKMKKLRPYAQQHIVAEALTTWLQKNGYLAQ